jgi:hypothetical protein
VIAAGRRAAQTQKEAASPPLPFGKAAAPGLGDAPREDTGPPLSVKAGCDPRATADREAAWHTYTQSPALTLSLRRPPRPGKAGRLRPAPPGRGASDAHRTPHTSRRQVSKDELAFDSQKNNRNHKNPLTGSVHASRGLPEGQGRTLTFVLSFWSRVGAVWVTAGQGFRPRGKGAASQVQLAARMLEILAKAFPGREVHGTGDAAFHGEALAVKGTTWTTRLPASAVLHGPKPLPTGKRGRPRAKGDRIGTCNAAAATLAWEDVTVHVYGSDKKAQVASCPALWHGSFKDAPGRLVLMREPGSEKPYDLGIFTLDTTLTPAGAIERYSWRWPIEPSNATGKQVLGVGDACNRVQKAVERTVPFGFLIQTLLITWYARSASDPADIERRRRECPWYLTKTTPSAADMAARLRRDLHDARISASLPGHSCFALMRPPSRG